MGEVVSLAEIQTKRREERQERFEQAAMHPVLRWVADEAGRAHRRRTIGGTACGIDGPLVLAETGTELCGVCYPYWASVAP